MSAPWTTRADLQITLRNMAEAGIDRTIIFPIENPGYEKANEEIAEICGRYPKKFLGFARHDETIESGRIARMLKREVESLGLRGFKIIGRPPDRETLDLIAELGIPVLYHAPKVAAVRELAESYPRIQFIIAHMGNYNYNWNENVEAVGLARQYPNIYLETSCCAYRQVFEMTLKEAGSGKLIFGSDGPEFDSRLVLYRIKLLKLPPAEEEQVLGGTIQRLLPKGRIL
jgi:predicted TIM-barrel fold metal-dependent hydrolase